MKMNVYIIAGILLCLAIVIFMACRSKTNAVEKSAGPTSAFSDSINQQDSAFNDLRKMALSTTPDQLGIEVSENQTNVYGIVMDWNLGGGTATVAAYQTGDASMYLSSGGGVIGGGQDDAVKAAAISYVKSGQDYLDNAIPTDTMPLPKENGIHFYLLTTNGIYYGEEKMDNIEAETSDWLGLFEEANNVLTQLRSTVEMK